MPLGSWVTTELEAKDLGSSSNPAACASRVTLHISEPQGSGPGPLGAAGVEMSAGLEKHHGTVQCSLSRRHRGERGAPLHRPRSSGRAAHAGCMSIQPSLPVQPKQLARETLAKGESRSEVTEMLQQMKGNICQAAQEINMTSIKLTLKM